MSADVYDYQAASNSRRERNREPALTEAAEAITTMPTSAAHMIAGLVAQAQGRTLHYRRVEQALVFLTGSATIHPSMQGRTDAERPVTDG